MRRSRSAEMTAQVHMHGPFDTNRYDLHPPGTKLITLDDPKERQSFAPHGVPAYYLGIAPDHYRSYRVYVPSTNKIRITNSVAWIPPTPIVPKYPTLPPGLFSNQPTPVQQNTPTRTHVAASEGVPQLVIPSILTPMLEDVPPQNVAAKPPHNDTPPPSPVSIAQTLLSPP
ncbi:MAG: hypothetical protein ACK56F_32490, partial [bacterium]